NLLAPVDPATKTLDSLIATLTKHFQPATLEIAERQRFFKRMQAEFESISVFVAELRRLALTCNFEATLDLALRDQFLSGVRNDSLKKKLMIEDDLTFEKAFQLAYKMEAADRDIT